MNGVTVPARIPPLDPPYSADDEALLASLMPDGVPPIGLFRTFVHNRDMTVGVRGWGSYYLSRSSSLSLRQRELVIMRTTARCGCEYEWGVHVVFFAEAAKLNTAQLGSITHGSPTDDVWASDDRVLLEVIDALHDESTLDDDLAERAAEHLTTPQLLDVYLLAGWYHGISYVANAAAVELEPGTPRFGDIAPPS